MKILRFVTYSMFFLFTMIQAKDKRSNVLWIYLEDVSGWFSCYGESLIKTPNIDQLAKEGIRFDRFYTPAGVCSATRSAIVTGMMQTSIGAHNHRSCRKIFGEKIWASMTAMYWIFSPFRKFFGNMATGPPTIRRMITISIGTQVSSMIMSEQAGSKPDAFISGKMLRGQGRKAFFCANTTYTEGKGGLRDSMWCNLSR